MAISPAAFPYVRASRLATEWPRHLRRDGPLADESAITCFRGRQWNPDPGGSGRREASPNRQDALTAASNLIREQSDEVKADVHGRSRVFVDGDQDGSLLDSKTTNPHPLSAMKIDFGSSSLRAAGLCLAQYSAVTHDERMWVRDRAAVMLSANDKALVRESAMTLSRLGLNVIDDLDATLLVGRPQRVARELAAFLAATAPTRYAQTLHALAADPDRIVRTQPAQRLNDAYTQPIGAATESAEPNQTTPIPSMLHERSLPKSSERSPRHPTQCPTCSGRAPRLTDTALIGS